MTRHARRTIRWLGRDPVAVVVVLLGVGGGVGGGVVGVRSVVGVGVGDVFVVVFVGVLYFFVGLGLVVVGVIGVVSVVDALRSRSRTGHRPGGSGRFKLAASRECVTDAGLEWAKRPRVQGLTSHALRIVAVVLPADQRQVWVADVAGSLASAEGAGEWTSYLLGQLVALPDHAWVFRWHRRRERVR